MKTVLIVLPSAGKSAMIENAMQLTMEVRKNGDIPIARSLDREYEDTPSAIEEMRSFERSLIRIKAIDKVVFADDRSDADIADASYAALRHIAKQYCYVS